MKTATHTPHAPAAIGPYSQAIRSGNTIYCSGQIALDPVTGELVNQSFKAEIQQVLHNLNAICQANDCTLDHFVKLTVYIVDFADYDILNQVFEQTFSTPYPARAVIAVKALPKNVRVEIEGVIDLQDYSKYE